MKRIILIVISLFLGSCAEIFNPNSNQSAIYEDNGMLHAKGTIIKAKKNITIRNEFEYEGDIEASLTAKSKDNTVNNKHGTKAE